MFAKIAKMFEQCVYTIKGIVRTVFTTNLFCFTGKFVVTHSQPSTSHIPWRAWCLRYSPGEHIFSRLFTSSTGFHRLRPRSNVFLSFCPIIIRSKRCRSAASQHRWLVKASRFFPLASAYVKSSHVSSNISNGSFSRGEIVGILLACAVIFTSIT